MQYVAYRSGCIRRNIVAPPEPEAFFRTCSVKNLSSATSFKIKKGRKPPRSTEVAQSTAARSSELLSPNYPRDYASELTCNSFTVKKFIFGLFPRFLVALREFFFSENGDRGLALTEVGSEFLNH